MSKWKTHPYADLFPMMTAAELEALTADIRENGLRQPIIRYQGMVLDGRNRLKACEAAGVEPTFTEHEGDEASALALVESSNVRRDLTSAQRAIVAAKRWGLDGYSKGGRPSKEKPVSTLPVSLDALARKYRVGKPAIIQARDLLSEAPDLASRVESCSLSLAAAYEQLQDRRKTAAQKAKDAERAGDISAEVREAISNGETTLEQAIQEALERQREAEEVRKSQADARCNWLKGFALMLDWIERNVIDEDDEYLAWYTEPDSPGLFEHGITAERVATVITNLERARDITFRSRNGEQGQEKRRSVARRET